MRLLFASLALVACYRSSTPTAPPPPPAVEAPPAKVTSPPESSPSLVTRTIEKLEGFADEMCSCGDQACAGDVTARLTKWSEEMAQQDATDEKPTDEETARMADFGRRYAECMTRLMAVPP